MMRLLQSGNLLLVLALASGQIAEAEKVLAEDRRDGVAEVQGSLGQIAQGSLTRVTGVEVIETEDGLELVLETITGSERLVPLVVPEGNNLAIEILDASLAFSIRNGITKLDLLHESSDR